MARANFEFSTADDIGGQASGSEESFLAFPGYVRWRHPSQVRVWQVRPFRPIRAENFRDPFVKILNPTFGLFLEAHLVSSLKGPSLLLYPLLVPGEVTVQWKAEGIGA